MERHNSSVLTVKLGTLDCFKEALKRIQTEQAYRQYRRQTARETRATALQPIVIRRRHV